MLSYIWPAILIVASNVVYNLTTKNTPGNSSPFLSLTVTYLVGAAASLALYLFTGGRGLAEELKRLDYTSFLLGLSIIGLEAGYIWFYRAGWKISVGSIVVNVALAVILLVIGALFYRERLGANQFIGIALCVAGLVFINLK